MEFFSLLDFRSPTFMPNLRVEGDRSRYLTPMYAYTERTLSSRKYRCYTSWYPHGSHVRGESLVGVISGRSLAPVLSRCCPSLSSFVNLRRGSVVSVQRGLLFPPFLSLSLSLALPPSPPLPSASCHPPTGGVGLFSLLRSLRKLLRLPPTIAVRRVSNEFGGACIVRRCVFVALGPRETARPVSLL